VETIAGGLRWTGRPECLEQLLGPDGLRLEAWLRTGQATIIKHGPHRTVYRVTLPGLDCYIKHFRVHGARSWLRELVRPCKARLEYDRALAVGAFQVPTIVPVALGEPVNQRTPGASYLVTLSLHASEPLDAFLENTLPALDQQRQTRIAQRLAVKLGTLLACMHDAGIVHNDLHAGNLLISLDEGDRPRLHVVDLHALSLRPALDWHARRANLIIFNHWFIMRVDRAHRLRFWKAYCQACRESIAHWWGQGVHESSTPALRQAVADLARDLEEATWTSNLRCWRSRDRRCLQANRHYQRISGRGIAGFAVAEIDPESLAPLLADPDGPFSRPDARLLKDSPTSSVAEIELTVNGVSRPMIYKRLCPDNWLHPWKSLARRTPALRSWVFGHGLRERCLPTPRPLLVLERTRHGLPHEGYLLTEKVPEALNLHALLAQLQRLPAASGRAALRRCIEQLGQLVRELHRRHLSQRDLKAHNILVSDTDPDPAAHPPFFSKAMPIFWLIDLVGVQETRRLTPARRLQNLSRLHASFHADPWLTRTDKLRFLRTYMQWGLFGKAGWKRIWRRIDRATRAKVEKNARNGRPLA
jgi:tRNA A-37 threonylcarbamoyl transferase component Bud32